MSLNWMVTGNLDVGATTPGGYIAPGQMGDPLCSHSGDELGAGANNVEIMGCSPAAAGTYILIIENLSGSAIPYTMHVNINGSPLAPFPITGTAPANALYPNTHVEHQFTLN